MNLSPYRLQVNMYVQRQIKSVYASTQSDQNLSFPPDETLNPWLPIKRMRSLIWFFDRCKYQLKYARTSANSVEFSSCGGISRMIPTCTFLLDSCSFLLPSTRVCFVSGFISTRGSSPEAYVAPFFTDRNISYPIISHNTGTRFIIVVVVL